jgi:DNA replication and repair protein RecF
LILKNLSLLNFKNYRDANFKFSPQINCLTGNNGSGKTNVLDAIYYLSFCKSYFNAIDSQNIFHDEQFFVVEGSFENEEETDKIYCGVKKGQKKIFKRNNKKYDKLSDHIGSYPAVIISPSDKDLVNEGSEVRRKFIDGVIAQYDKRYLEALLKYQKTLSHRNHLLKYFWENRTFDKDQIEIWNEQIVVLGNMIYKSRKNFIQDFKPLFERIYKIVSGGAETVDLQYESQLQSDDFSNLLINAAAKDRSRQRTTVGIHKDDLIFTIKGYPMKKFGSQGQQKSFVIALKLAQFEFISNQTGKKPILLLDDIFDKIDGMRLEYLLELVSDKKFGQIFITDTDQDRIVRTFRELDVDFESYIIEQGAIV